MSGPSPLPKTAPDFGSFIGNARAVDILRRAIARDRLPHGMIFAGPPGVGKCTLALMLARFVNCLAPERDEACGRCSPCKRIGAAILSRRLHCERRADRPCGGCPSCKIMAMRHPDLHLVEPKEGKSVISIEQVRDLIGEVAFQPIEARYRVMILDPADRMSIEAQNSLLKTLEEPQSRTLLILVTSNPHALLDTTRSRCRLLHFGEIPAGLIERRLVEVEGRPAAEARLAALLGGGSLAAALDFDVAAYGGILEPAFDFVSLLLGKGAFRAASATAAAVAKDKQEFRFFLDTVSLLLEDVYYAKIDPGRVGRLGLGDRIGPLARSVPRRVLVRAIEGVRKLQGDLRSNVNRQIALEALFIQVARR
ncbi:MAG: AAA family ATPase [Acidobacteriota bacterium]|nr:AAA family ATPase [Acidobacteriota bacterium]NLT33247.1 AAA family ATPase [Acidobacteriota bacterium]